MELCDLSRQMPHRFGTSVSRANLPVEASGRAGNALTSKVVPSMRPIELVRFQHLGPTRRHLLLDHPKPSVLAMGITIVLTILATSIFAQEIHADLCLHGCPSGSPASNDIVIRNVYVLSSNDATKFADWVAYRVTKSTIGPTAARVWKPDPWLAESETLEPRDYSGAFFALKTDRGHQAPLASFTSVENWEATNYLSNITPQKSELNRGVWVDLENAVRTLAKKPATDAVYVMTGPLYERQMPVLPGADESHRVPSGYWKIVSTESEGVIKIAALVIDQETERDASFCEERFITSARVIESKAGLNFFHALTATQQDKLETGPATLLPDLGCPA